MTAIVTLTNKAGASITLQGARGPLGTHQLADDPLGLDGAEVRQERIPRLTNGSLVGPTYREVRTLVFKGWTKCASIGDAERLRRTLSGFEPASMVYNHDDVTLAADCVPGAATRAAIDHNNATVDWLITLFTADPHLYGPARTVTVTPQGLGGGLQYPITYPISYGTATDASVILTNAGNDVAYPTVTVYVTDPSGFRLELDGHVVEVITPCTPAVPITVDMAGRITAAGGGDITSAATRSDWAAVPAHSASTFVLTTLQGGGGYALATIRDTYL